jgi:RNA polymerase sigma-70 factor (ECF subfamily)
MCLRVTSVHVSKTLQGSRFLSEQVVVTAFPMTSETLDLPPGFAPQETEAPSEPSQKDIVCTLTELLNPQGDGELLARIARGDELAMGAIFDSYSKIVYSVALRVLHDASLAEDVTQETFMKVWRHPTSFFSTKGSLGGWLAVVARNRSIDMLRRSRPSNELDQENLASPCDLFAQVERSILLQQAWSMVSSLPKVHRKYMEMAFYEGLSYCEIANVTGDPLGTVKTRMRKALSILRARLKA